MSRDSLNELFEEFEKERDAIVDAFKSNNPSIAIDQSENRKSHNAPPPTPTEQDISGFVGSDLELEDVDYKTLQSMQTISELSAKSVEDNTAKGPEPELRSTINTYDKGTVIQDVVSEIGQEAPARQSESADPTNQYSTRLEENYLSSDAIMRIGPKQQNPANQKHQPQAAIRRQKGQPRYRNPRKSQRDPVLAGYLKARLAVLHQSGSW